MRNITPGVRDTREIGTNTIYVKNAKINRKLVLMGDNVERSGATAHAFVIRKIYVKKRKNNFFFLNYAGDDQPPSLLRHVK